VVYYCNPKGKSPRDFFMLEVNVVEAGQIVKAVKPGHGSIFFKVQIVPGDGRAIVTKLGDKKHPIIIDQSIILEGGQVGEFTVLPPTVEDNKNG
jgi:hypothetical protein